ncbi:MAG: hypothetical protein U9N42_10925 [Campylobacterota bacterium]|nr:hypothetical protein [Campylobacterota bacterium]
MDKIITLALVVAAGITLWSVLTPNHLFVG